MGSILLRGVFHACLKHILENWTYCTILEKSQNPSMNFQQNRPKIGHFWQNRGHFAQFWQNQAFTFFDFEQTSKVEKPIENAPK